MFKFGLRGILDGLLICLLATGKKEKQKGKEGGRTGGTLDQHVCRVCCGVCVRCPKIRIEFNTKATRPNRDVVGVWGVLTLYVFRTSGRGFKGRQIAVLGGIQKDLT